MIFHFKQFAVNQAECTMKVGTDSVLLGASAHIKNPKTILDIGTGTGVIALMLAQRFPQANIDAVEIDHTTAQMAIHNFENSIFTNRIQGYQSSFEDYLEQNPKKKYDLIVSNPPFFINSLESSNLTKKLARHTNEHFFERFIQAAASHLQQSGALWLILPPKTTQIVKNIGLQYQLFLQQQIQIHSFPQSKPHRELIAMGFQNKEQLSQSLVIYDAPKLHSKEYQLLLKDFLIIF